MDTQEPEKLVELRTLANEFQAGVIASILEEAGVYATTSSGDGASLGIFGATGFRPTSVWVRAADVERAEDVLEQRREESVDLDWSEVDVGDPDPDDKVAQRIAARDASAYCPGCGAALGGAPAGAPCPECGRKLAAARRGPGHISPLAAIGWPLLGLALFGLPALLMPGSATQGVQVIGVVVLTLWAIWLGRMHALRRKYGRAATERRSD